MRKNDAPFDILLVEDNCADIRLTTEAFREAGVDVILRAVPDGEQALRVLRGDGQDDGRKEPLPDLILLDLNLPRKDGRAVLASIKEDPELKRIPVVVLTTSEAQSDVDRAYELHANCYVSKPLDLGEFIRVVGLISEFWLKTAKLPRSERHA